MLKPCYELRVGPSGGFIILVSSAMSSLSASSSGTTKDVFNDYSAGLQAVALKATKHSAGLPSDVAFYKSIDRDLANNLDTCSDKALSLLNRLLNLASTADSAKSAKGKSKARLEEQDDLVDRFESTIVESMDQLLERAVSALNAVVPDETSYTSPGYMFRPIFRTKQSTSYRRQTCTTRSQTKFRDACTRCSARCPFAQTPSQVQAKGGKHERSSLVSFATPQI